LLALEELSLVAQTSVNELAVTCGSILAPRRGQLVESREAPERGGAVEADCARRRCLEP
jgi:hypothetical protein